MDEIIWILQNNTGITSLLANGSSSVYSLEVPQEEPTPHIVVDETDTVAYDTKGVASSIDDVYVRIFTISDKRAGTGGSSTIANVVRAEIDALSGTFNGVTITSIKFDNQEVTPEGEVNKKRIVVEQEYLLKRKR